MEGRNVYNLPLVQEERDMIEAIGKAIRDKYGIPMGKKSVIQIVRFSIRETFNAMCYDKQD